jgi:Domain of unknown function (DUF1918)
MIMAFGCCTRAEDFDRQAGLRKPLRSGMVKELLLGTGGRSMQAHVGDWVVIESSKVDSARRAGQVVELRHPDGTPPFLVHWQDTGQTTLTFPGPDARVVDSAGYEALTARWTH